MKEKISPRCTSKSLQDQVSISLNKSVIKILKYNSINSNYIYKIIKAGRRHGNPELDISLTLFQNLNLIHVDDMEK